MLILWGALSVLYAGNGIQLLYSGDGAGAVFLGLMAVSFGALSARSWKKRQAKK